MKRADAFLGLPRSGVSKAERSRESDSVRTYSNPFASVAFFLVSLVMVAGALALLLEAGANSHILAAWTATIVAAESALLFYSLRVRTAFDADSKHEKKPPT